MVEGSLDKAAVADDVVNGVDVGFWETGDGVDVIKGVAKSRVANRLALPWFKLRLFLGIDLWWSPLSLFGPRAPSDPTGKIYGGVFSILFLFF